MLEVAGQLVVIVALDPFPVGCNVNSLSLHTGITNAFQQQA